MPAKSKNKASVSYGCGFTINLGNYESARIDVGVEIQGDREELPELWRKAETEVTEQMTQQVQVFKEQLDQKRTLLGMEKGASFKG